MQNTRRSSGGGSAPLPTTALQTSVSNVSTPRSPSPSKIPQLDRPSSSRGHSDRLTPAQLKLPTESSPRRYAKEVDGIPNFKLSPSRSPGEPGLQLQLPIEQRSSAESNTGSLSTLRARADQAQIEALEADTVWLRKEQSTLTETVQELEKENKLLLQRAQDAEARAPKQGKKVTPNNLCLIVCCIHAVHQGW